MNKDVIKAKMLILKKTFAEKQLINSSAKSLV